MLQEFKHLEKVSGELELPGDKSISHRAVIFSAMANGVSEISNLSDGADVNSSISCLESMGVEIERVGRSARIKGKGFKSFINPALPLDAGNSGTTARLLSGLLATQNFETLLIGDESLSKRPMDRVTVPLKLMGANFEFSHNNTLPLRILPAPKLKPISYRLPIPSAQVKSAVLIAGLHCEGFTSVTDAFKTRDHTERMLGLRTEVSGKEKIIYSSVQNYPKPSNYFVPSDISTASFFIILTLLSKSSSLRLKNVSLNPSRIGILKVLKEMGGTIEIENERRSNNEPFGDIVVKNSLLKNVLIESGIIPNIIDEIPILSVAGLFAEGEFVIKCAKELRKKESDRINSLCHNYRLLGLNIEEYDDGFSISGEVKNQFPIFNSFHDHRIAMAFAVLAMLLKDGAKIDNFECVAISNPNFIFQLKKIAE